MSWDEFHLFLTYLYLFGNKHVKSKLSISRVFLMYEMIDWSSPRKIYMKPPLISPSNKNDQWNIPSKVPGAFGDI